MIKIAVDAMGGDFAPDVAIEGALLAVESFDESDIQVILVGHKEVLRKKLVEKSISLPENVSIYHAPDKVLMSEAPVEALRKKKYSSISVAANLVKQGKADVLVTAGNTGSAVASTTLKWRLLPGVDRSGIALPFPHSKGVSVLLDAGANVSCKPVHLYHYAIMGKIYSEIILKKKNVSIGLLNVGEEDCKGGEEMKEVFALFKDAYFNFIGNVEGRDLFNGRCDVIICDGFVGNVVLKVAEGVVSTVTEMAKKEIKKRPLSILGALLAKPAFGALKKKIDYSVYGGAPLLGVNGVCIIAHGSSNGKALFNAIRVAYSFAKCTVNQVIMKEIKSYAVI